MLPIHKILWHEGRAAGHPARVPEPSETMESPEQIRSYVRAYEWGGPTSALQMHHLRELSKRIRPGDTLVDLACGPGPLLLELAHLYPASRFYGADLSKGMLAHLEQEARTRGLKNISTLHEDIRTLPSLAAQSVDLVISTSALHHLPDSHSLDQVFRRTTELLKAGGGIYFFDFALLKSEHSRRLMVEHIASSAPPVTVRDYEVSLAAAFPIEEVWQIAQSGLGRDVSFIKSSFVDIFYFLQTAPRTLPESRVESALDAIYRTLPFRHRLEYNLLRSFRSRVPMAPRP